MAKLRTRGKTAPVQYWINYETGRVGIGRGKEHALEKKANGFTEVGPKTFARFCKAPALNGGVGRG